MNFTFANLLGSPYRGGALVLHGDTLICPAGNRVREINLREATSATLPVQSPHQVCPPRPFATSARRQTALQTLVNVVG